MGLGGGRQAAMRWAFIAALAFAAAVYVLEIPSYSVYERQAYRIVHAVVTAYTSDPAETDDTPTITASGTTTRPGVAANNCLPFGTRIEVGGRRYVVEDRMNARYGCDRYDLWTESKSDALSWGRRKVEVSIALEYPRKGHGK